MFRALCLLAVVTIGAVPAAPAQTRAIIQTSLMNPGRTDRPPDLVVRVNNLLGATQWTDALHNAYPIKLHWRAQLWRSRGLLDGPLPPFEWDVTIQQVPVVDVFRYTETIAGHSNDTSFSTFEALKAYVGDAVRIPTPASLAPGRWYYTADLHIAALTQEQLDQRSGGGPLGWLERLILGSGPSADLPRQKTATFTVLPR